MEILTGILAFLEIASLVFTLRDKLTMTKDEKTVLSEGLINIGHLIYSVAEDLNQGKYPAGKCHQMELYAANLENILKNKISEKDLQRLKEALNQSLNVEKLLGELNNQTPEIKNKNLEMLEIAGSSFIASGEMIKLKY